MTYEEAQYFNELLTIEESANDLKVSKSMVEKWKAREWNPLRFSGQGKNQRISRSDLREWYKKYSDTYKISA
jgi:excisionase family DNA binding protein